jgi:hypothetical protein
MEDCTMNMLFALIVGKSINGNLNGKNALNNMWEYIPGVTFCVHLLMDSHRHRQLLEAATNGCRHKPKGVSQ